VLRLIVRRLLGVVPVLLLVSFLAFSLVHLVPGDAAIVAAGDHASPELIKETRERLGLDQPFLAQFGTWLGAAVTGDLGTSLFSSQSTWDAIAERIPVTGSLTALALVWALVLGLGLGLVAGLRPGGWVDRATTTLATLGISMPSFWIGLLLVSFLSLQTPIFPATGYVPLSEGFGPWLSHLFLPSLALGAPTAAEVARQGRAALVQVMEQDYIRTATAKGLSPVIVVGKHALKNAAIPVVTVFGLQAAHLIGGAVVVEQVFGVPGLGMLALGSILQRDFPLLQACVVVIAVFVLIVNLLVDLSYGLFNPKVRQT
jgi:peptide/nickel transport system permease protein